AGTDGSGARAARGERREEEQRRPGRERPGRDGRRERAEERGAELALEALRLAGSERRRGELLVRERRVGEEAVREAAALLRGVALDQRRIELHRPRARLLAGAEVHALEVEAREVEVGGGERRVAIDRLRVQALGA